MHTYYLRTFERTLGVLRVLVAILLPEVRRPVVDERGVHELQAAVRAHIRRLIGRHRGDT